jgi:AcrR family transcriptional regulator
MRSAWQDTGLSRKEQFEKKRMALLRAAGRAFSRKGFHDTSLDEVAENLKVSKAALYYYFKSKHELLFECHKVSFEVGENAFRRAEAEGKNKLEVLRLFLRRYIEALTGTLGSCAVLLEVNALSPRDRSEILARRDAFGRKLRKLIADGVREGTFSPVDPKMTELFLMGSINWLTRWYSPEGPLSGAEIAEHFISLLFRGVMPREEAPALRKAARA